MKKLWIGIGMIVIVVLAVVLIITQTKKEPNEIKIGILSSLTGESARYGQNALNGVMLAIGEINGMGGVKGRRIKLIIEDDASQASRSVSAFKKLATVDKVPIIIGPISSSAAMSCSPIANELKVVLFSPAAATPKFTSPRDYTFRNRVSSDYEITSLAQVAYQKLVLRKIAILYVNNDFGLGSKLSFENRFQELGGTIPIVETFEEGSTDLRTQLSKIKNANTESILIVGQGTEGGYALRQARELGIKTQFLSVLSIQREDVLKIAGDASEGVIYVAPIYKPTSFQQGKNFEEKYKNKFHANSDLFAGNGYDAVYILVEAIKTGGFNTYGIRDALFKIKQFPGVTGETSFDENGDVYKPVGLKRIHDGKFIDYNID